MLDELQATEAPVLIPSEETYNSMPILELINAFKALQSERVQVELPLGKGFECKGQFL